MENQNDYIITDFSENFISENEAREVYKLQKEFLESYNASKDKYTVETWLQAELHKHLPEKSADEIEKMSSEIIDTIKLAEEMKISQQKAIDAGRSRESWLAKTLQESTSHISATESTKYLQSLDNVLAEANAEMYNTIMTKGSGYTVPSRNPNLDGFIAEQHHVNSFNMKAAATGSDIRAEIQPFKEGGTYTKNGFDVIIKDSSGKRIHQYQMKYGATAEDTIRMIKDGNYNNQKIVVPAEQVEAVQKAFPNKTITSTIGDGAIKSSPLSKMQAKDLQKKAQKGNFAQADWSTYSSRDLAIGIGNQVAKSALMGATIGICTDVVKKVINGETVDCEELIDVALTTGGDYAVKSATAATLKVAAEKGILKMIPKGTPASTFADIAFITVEDIKIMKKIASGELTAKEGLYEMEKTTRACLAGIVYAAKGTAIGAEIGLVFGPIGATIGGFVGGTLGYMAGSKVGQAVATAAQKVREVAVNAVKSAGKTIANGIKAVGRAFSKVFG